MKPPGARLILGSRGSALARAQSELVTQQLQGAWPDLEIELRIIRTSGDEGAAATGPIDRKAGRKGMFTAEIERALLAGEIDVAVHSAKDLPSEFSPQAMIGAVLERAPVHDVLVSKHSGGIHSLGQKATIATGSIRRACQWRAEGRDFSIVDLRGNVPTRLRKLVASDWEGAVLAAAGLSRLGFDLSLGRIDFEGTPLWLERLDPHEFVPAGGQGVIAMQIRRADRTAAELLGKIDHSATAVCLRAEREFLRLLQGDCDSPVGVLAELKDTELLMQAEVFALTTHGRAAASVRGNAAAPEKVAADLHARIPKSAL